MARLALGVPAWGKGGTGGAVGLEGVTEGPAVAVGAAALRES